MDKKILKAFSDEIEKISSASSPEEELSKAKLPDLVEAGYAHPNPDKSRKNCGNCCLFLDAQGACMVVKGKISPKGMCSYHVFGTPMRREDYDVPKPEGQMDQKLAGYVNSVPNGGTSCDTCTNSRDGVCVAVQKNGKPAPIESKGCCNRWHLKK